MLHRRAKVSVLPPRLEGLAALVTNLSWSWSREARALLRRIDPPLWRMVRQNPIELLREVPPSRLEQLARDPDFLVQYDRVMEWMALDRQQERTWFARRYPLLLERPVAYFCAEFGLHSSVPIYSGGLGVLAGDHCKSASDLGVPLVGVGLSYMKGYFDQRLRSDGWQEDSDDHVDPALTPLVELRGPRGEAWLAVVNTFGRPVHVRVWTMGVGRVTIYLLDTNLEENHPEDRTLLNKLYGGGPDLRLRQEWLLGVGGVRVLRAVGLDPGAWHAHEGPAALLVLEGAADHPLPHPHSGGGRPRCLRPRADRGVHRPDLGRDGYHEGAGPGAGPPSRTPAERVPHDGAGAPGGGPPPRPPGGGAPTGRGARRGRGRGGPAPPPARAAWRGRPGAAGGRD